MSFGYWVADEQGNYHGVPIEVVIKIKADTIRDEADFIVRTFGDCEDVVVYLRNQADKLETLPQPSCTEERPCISCFSDNGLCLETKKG